MVDRFDRIRKSEPLAPRGTLSLGSALPLLSLLSLLSFLALLAAPALARAGSDGTKSSCVRCHSNPDWLVQNKKLYDYYQNWTRSVHAQEEVACDDCHGGNAELADKDAAHGGDISGSAAGSAVNFLNVPETCGRCHDDILEGFKQSEHFQHVANEEQEEQGPNCVTCHGSINVEVLDVNTVAESCARCHNEETDNYPENPEKAHQILNRFLSIHRFYRYITRNAEAEEAHQFFSKIDVQLRDLSVTWHTFDLKEIEKKTASVLAALKTKRDEIRTRKKAEKAEQAAKAEIP